MELKHIKLRNHEDLLSFVTVNEQDKRFVVLSAPISVHLDPDRGFYAKHWLVFSEDNSVNIPIDSILFVNKANKKAVDYYDEFFKRLKEKDDDAEVPDSIDELENMFASMLEAKNSTKH